MAGIDHRGGPCLWRRSCSPWSGPPACCHCLQSLDAPRSLTERSRTTAGPATSCAREGWASGIRPRACSPLLHRQRRRTDRERPIIALLKPNIDRGLWSGAHRTFLQRMVVQGSCPSQHGPSQLQLQLLQRHHQTAGTGRCLAARRHSREPGCPRVSCRHQGTQAPSMTLGMESRAGQGVMISRLGRASPDHQGHEGKGEAHRQDVRC